MQAPMEMRHYHLVGLVAVLLVLHVLAAQTETRSAGEEFAMADDQGPLVGGIQDAPEGRENDLHVLDLARFAVSEHNKMANALLEFEKVVKVKEQVVSGVMYYFTIEVKEGDVKKLYEAKVWEKQWMNFKELQEFKPVEDGASA